jgi:4-hydroxy-3-methylbut-2-enyl diphosphate reductase
MQVVLARSAGFCWGVERAVRRARELASASDRPIYTEGPLIHNREMMEQLRAEGVLETDDPESVSDNVLLIRAHGVCPARRRLLSRLPARIVDATCPDVARIQGLIRKHARRGYTVIIHGDPGHAEVDGLLGYAEGRGRVVTSPEDVDRLPDLQRVCLVAQSTQFTVSYGRVADAVRRRFPGSVVLDTICRSTKNRQRELVAIAGRVDAIVVVGGAHSANTMRLVGLARTLRPTFHIQRSDQIQPAEFRSLKAVGLTAGASTPAFVIEKVRERLERIP